MRAGISVCLVAAAAVTALVPGRAAAQGAAGGWDHSLMVYMLGAGMDGTVAVGPVEGDVSASFSEIVKNLQLGGMVSYRGEHGDFAILGDLVYMGLGATKSGERGVKADVNADEWVAELDGAWRVSPGFELLGGVRYISLAADVTVSGPQQVRRAETTESWVDPVAGFQVKAPLGGAWSFEGRGDVGGFGVGSDFAWQGLVGLRVAFSPRSSMLVAYRALDIDYESGSGTSYFRYDVLTQGPMLGFSFSL